MLLPLPQLPDAWDALRGATRLGEVPIGGSGPVLVFVAADVDSVAAARTLTALLKADLVRYEVHAVGGYAELQESFMKLVGAQPRAVLCVNCGASVDLEKILGFEEIQRVPPIYVLDVHRPYHLKNLSSQRVVLLDDEEHFDHAGLPIDAGWEDEWGNVSDHDLSDASDSESEESDMSSQSDAESEVESNASVDEVEIGGDSRHDRNSEDSLPRSSAVDDEEVSAESKTDAQRDGSVSGETKRSREDHEATETESVRTGLNSRLSKRRRSGEKDERSSVPAGERPRRRRRRRRRRGMSTDAEAEEKEALRSYYAECTQSMSSACLSHNLAASLRRSSVDTLWMAIVGVTAQYVSSSVSERIYQDALAYFRAQIAALGGSEPEDAAQADSGASYKESDGARIYASTELRLDLVRHWTLYDSLLHSSYTVARLGAWRQQGRRRLQELLATLGIPLKESKQRWCFMRADCKTALDERLSSALRRFDLGRSMQYDSFVRSRRGHRGAVCAADIAAASSALLELSDGELSARFWGAYDALGDAQASRSGVLDGGLSLAVEVQKLASSVGGEVIERRKFVPSGPFRYVFLRDQLASRTMLARPMLLRRVALFLIDALARQGAKDKPFVVLAADTERGVWLAVAATSRSRKNDFGTRFQKAAEKNGSHVVHSGFDSGVCEIRDGQEVEFIRFLHDVMR